MNSAALKILNPISVDEDNFNAQSLNARELALRMDPMRFRITLPYARKPDSRLLGHKHIRLLKLPPRFGSLRLFASLCAGEDILFNPSWFALTKLFLKLPRALRPSRHVQYLESPLKEALEHESDLLAQGIEATFRSADRVVSITEEVASRAREHYGIESCAVIPVGVDRAVFRPRKRETRARVRVLFVGHLIERKGPQHVLDAAREFPDVEFSLVGSGRDSFANELFARRERDGLENVRFLPPMRQRDLSDLMAEMDLMLLPSHVESFSKAVLEAASTGLPSIMFAWDRSPAVVDGRTGFQVSTSEEMIERLAQLVRNPPLRLAMGAEAERHSAAFSWDQIAERWSSIFARTLDISAG